MEALYVIQDYQNILEKDLAALIPIHIDLLCTLERYDQAYSVLEYYSNLPYQSQVVEELLVEMKNIIAKEEKKNQLYTISDEQLIKYLHSQNKEDVLYAIDVLKKRDVFDFLIELCQLMRNHPSQIIRSLVLLLLVDKEVDRNLPFLSYQGMITVNPKNAPHPFSNQEFNDLVNKINHETDDLTLSQNGVQILSNLALYIYPFEIDKDLDEILLAVILTSKKYLGVNILDIELEAKNKGLEKEKVIYYFDLINSALNE